jgi:hypothetical protein
MRDEKFGTAAVAACANNGVLNLIEWNNAASFAKKISPAPRQLAANEIEIEASYLSEIGEYCGKDQNKWNAYKLRIEIGLFLAVHERFH